MFKRLEIMVLRHLGILEHHERMEKFSVDMLTTLREIAEASTGEEANMLKEFTDLVSSYVRDGDNVDKLNYVLLGDYKNRPDLITKLVLGKIIMVKPSI